MYVKKRNGETEEVSFDKVKTRILLQSKDLKFINPIEIAQKVCTRIYDGVKTTELDELTSQICACHITDHPDYGILASRIIISNHQKNTSPSFSETVEQLYNHYDTERGIKNQLISDELYEFVENNKGKLNDVIDYDRDYLIDYFGFKTLERSYLLSVNKQVIERPQHLFMRVAIGIHGNDLKDILETYELMSKKYFIHATPTLFNSGTPRPQMASCFLQAMEEDSIDGIYKTLGKCANISKYSGGLGLHIHNIRGNGAYIRGTHGKSNGIIPMLGVFNKTAMYVDQCFRGDTHIYTLDGPIKIERIKEGNKVLTKEGSYKKVLKVIKNTVKKPTLRIRTQNAIDTIYVTKEHQVYALQDVPSVPLNEIEKVLENENKIIPKFIDAKKLTTFDYIGYPIPDTDVDDLYDDDYCMFSGIVFGNGVIEKDICEVSFYRDKGYDSRMFLVNYLSDNDIEHEQILNKNFNIIKWKITDQDESKPITNIYDLNKENTASFLKGCLKANGCSINDNYKAMFYNTQNKRIGYSIRNLFFKLEVLVDGFYKANHNHYVICIPYTNVLFEMFEYKGKLTENLTYFKYKDILWTGIKSIDEMKEFNGMVYDLNIEDNHNYVTEMGIVHNSGKRNGNIAIYLEPSHPDIWNFIQLRKNHGNEEERCRELFTALWMPDLFMERVEKDEMWSLFCPDTYPELSELYGEEYKKRYVELENDNKYVKQIKAQDLWKEICISQKETGTPYICYKDACNIKSNQNNIGTIKSSNLCSEIIEYSDKDETAVCNLASIGLPMFIEDGKFNFKKLHKIAQILTKNLNKIIDRGFYPIIEAKRSNERHRPIGIGVQGLADVFAIMKYSFDSNEAKELNKQIFETIYHGALSMSCDLALKYGTYSTYKGSPISRDILQYDMWKIEPSELWDWKDLKEKIKKNGIRNSLLISLMPTASTSQILGFNECFEPFTSNIYNRRTLAGEFFIVNKYLIKELIELGIWNKDIKNKIIHESGSIQNIDEIPDSIKTIYKTAFELHPRSIIDQAIQRGPYICQSQSMNLFIEEPDITRISNIHFYTWKNGLKTGLYYLRTKPKAKMQQFTIEPEKCESCSA
tara:strand:- start:2601 stop:5873 length:3273 start_codon:yes stop_codon:yes gene_type:complete